MVPRLQDPQNWGGGGQNWRKRSLRYILVSTDSVNQRGLHKVSMFDLYNWESNGVNYQDNEDLRRNEIERSLIKYSV